MKKLLFGLASICLLQTLVLAQVCTPDALYADSTFGAWPDTITNFVTGSEGIAYFQVLDFKVPSNANEVNSGIPATVVVDSFKIIGVAGLPTGLTYECGVTSCIYMGGDQGCILIDGIPSTSGSYPIVINSIAYSGTLNVPYDFTGYVINIDAVGVVEIAERDFFVTQNSPNPFNGNTLITYYSKRMSNVVFEVYNLLGKKVYSKTYSANWGENIIDFDSGNIPNGVYMYTLIQGDKVVTKKMTIAGE